MKFVNIALAIITMLVVSSCNRCKTQIIPSRVLNRVVFQKADLSLYVFDVKMGDRGFITGTDTTHHITVAAINGANQTIGAGFAKGYYVIVGGDTVSKVDFLLQSYPTSSEQTLTGLKSVSKDTTKLYNLGNVTYDLSSGIVTTTTDGLNYNFYRVADTVIYDSLFTGRAGTYNTDVHCKYVYNNGPSRQFSGTKNYLYSEDISVWIMECAIRFSNAQFSEYNWLHPIRLQRNLDLDTLFYADSRGTRAIFANTYMLNTDKYVVAQRQITDISGKQSYIHFEYQ